ncbi:hypothetical protein CMI37_14970 [Candidatus Pacearchaeota archaeon]|nr:hypothetical protein [Candidatus Pacearchaeota archaeon]|tara:strand:- start:564 stop:884 length:321 start_codon:yes stop_codon:yes gene_type:complete
MAVEKLTKQDVELLIEAVEEWEQLGFHEFFSHTAIKAMMIGSDPDKERLIGEMIDQNSTKARAQVEGRKERSILIRGKLILMRDALVAESFIDDCQKDAANETPGD